ncbi:MAG: PhoU domain-containing protein, partial [Hyphomicrobiales bacterium]
MMNEHTAKAFDEDLQELTRKVAEMGGLAEREISDSIQALTRRDATLAMRVVAADPTIDALQQEIEEKAVLTIARRQPMAVDLREIVAALRVANDLERIGDLAKNIGKRVNALDSDFHPLKLIRGLDARHRFCLTGTPLENHLGELWSLFTVVSPNWASIDRQRA